MVPAESIRIVPMALTSGNCIKIKNTNLIVQLAIMLLSTKKYVNCLRFFCIFDGRAVTL